MPLNGLIFSVLFLDGSLFFAHLRPISLDKIALIVD